VAALGEIGRQRESDRAPRVNIIISEAETAAGDAADSGRSPRNSYIKIRASDDPDIRDGAPAARELQNFIRSRIVQFWPHISDDSLALLVKKFLPLCQR